MINNIKKLLASDLVSNYKISQDTKISQSTLSDYTSGKTDISKMPLERAVLLNNYYMEVFSVKERSLTFGRMFAILDIISESVNEDGVGTISIEFLKDFSVEPQKIWERAHDRIMEKARLFGKWENYLIDELMDEVNKMNPKDFTNEPLDDVFMWAIHDKRHELRQLKAAK